MRQKQLATWQITLPHGVTQTNLWRMTMRNAKKRKIRKARLRRKQYVKAQNVQRSIDRALRKELKRQLRAG